MEEISQCFTKWFPTKFLLQECKYTCSSFKISMHTTRSPFRKWRIQSKRRRKIIEEDTWPFSRHFPQNIYITLASSSRKLKTLQILPTETFLGAQFLIQTFISTHIPKGCWCGICGQGSCFITFIPCWQLRAVS
jgi:hypothetical protein